MVSFQTVDAATVNVTTTKFTHELHLVDGLFGLCEFQTVLNFPERHGRSWTLSVSTSDVAISVLLLLIASFAIDCYFFKSRYLVHIVGARKQKDQKDILDEKAVQHEKEVGALESREVHPEEGGNNLEPQAAPKPRRHWRQRAVSLLFMILLLVLYHALGIGRDSESKAIKKEVPDHSSTKAEADELARDPPPTSRWAKFKSYILSCVILPSVFLFTLFVIAYRLLFWPWVLTLDILLQCSYYAEDIVLNHTITWQSIALKATLHLVVWTVVMVSLLTKPNRLQVPLWRGLKWMHAMTWWPFWIMLQSHNVGSLILPRLGFPYTGLNLAVVLAIMRPVIVAYYYSGILYDVVKAVRYVKYFWDNDIFEL